jgi:hypothetical protein
VAVAALLDTQLGLVLNYKNNSSEFVGKYSVLGKNDNLSQDKDESDLELGSQISEKIFN